MKTAKDFMRGDAKQRMGEVAAHEVTLESCYAFA